jgi:tetratricopeptide (TPR) repeat protein
MGFTAIGFGSSARARAVARTTASICLVGGIGFGIALGLGPPGHATTLELIPLPEPAVDNLEEPIQAQLQSERTKLDEIRDSESVTRVELAEAFGNLCQYYFVYELFEVSEVCFLNASWLDPGDFRWHYYLGAIYRALGDSERARSSLVDALAIRPDSVPTLLRLGRIDLDSNRLDESKTEYLRALELAPQSAAAHDGLGRIAYQQREYESAIEHLSRALELQPKATSIHHLLGMAYRETGDLDQARFHLQQNQHGFVTFQDPLVYGLADRIAGARFHTERANKAVSRHNLPEAVAAYRMALTIDPEDASTHYNLAVALDRLGSHSDAIGEFRQALALDPDYRDAHFNLGVALSEEGSTAEASRHFEQAYKIDPEDQQSHLEWAVTLYDLDQKQRAESELRSIIETEPENSRALLYLGAILADRGQGELALRQLEEVLELSDDSEERAQAHLLVAIESERMGRDEEAVARFRAALDEDPSLSPAQARLGSALARLGRFGEAAQQFEAAVEADPDSEGLRFGHAMTLLLGEDYAQALSALDRSVAALPDSVSLKHLLARLLATSPDGSVRNGARALELAQEVLDQQASLVHAETVAMALAELGRFEEAVARQQQVLVAIEAQNRAAQAKLARQRLSLYENGQPCRAPWLDG